MAERRQVLMEKLWPEISSREQRILKKSPALSKFVPVVTVGDTPIYYTSATRWRTVPDVPHLRKAAVSIRTAYEMESELTLTTSQLKEATSQAAPLLAQVERFTGEAVVKEFEGVFAVLLAKSRRPRHWRIADDVKNAVGRIGGNCRLIYRPQFDSQSAALARDGVIAERVVAPEGFPPGCVAALVRMDRGPQLMRSDGPGLTLTWGYFGDDAVKLFLSERFLLLRRRRCRFFLA
jgi:hypothetical protein